MSQIFKKALQGPPGPPGPIGHVQVNNQVFTTSGTYTPTANMVYCSVEMLGGGGGGGGSDTTMPFAQNVGTGGGGGEYAVGIFSAATIGASQTVTIGAAGTTGIGVNGGDGGTTSLGILITAVGGGGGPMQRHLTNAFGGISGTGGSGGDYRCPGQNGTGCNNAYAGETNGANSQLGVGGL